MRHLPGRCPTLLSVLFAVAVTGACALARRPEVPYVPTPPPVVGLMLETAGVRPDDVLYDLGSGDGRIVIAAARRFGTRGVGYDIDPARVREANENARRAGVTDKVRFVHGDIFEADIREATVVTLYLLPVVNLRLRPKLLRELRPGTRIVSHAFDMGDWRPEKTRLMTVNDVVHTVYFWTVPPGPTTRWPSGARRSVEPWRAESHRNPLTGWPSGQYLGRNG